MYPVCGGKCMFTDGSRNVADISLMKRLKQRYGSG
jgi:hypothetical protein